MINDIPKNSIVWIFIAIALGFIAIFSFKAGYVLGADIAINGKIKDQEWKTVTKFANFQDPNYKMSQLGLALRRHMLLLAHSAH